jgi:hypothetical protein
MCYKIGCILILLSFLSGCGAGQGHPPFYKLASGKEIQVIGIGKVQIVGHGPIYELHYVTALPTEDKTAVRKEVDEIWETLQKDVDKTGLDAAIIYATRVEGDGPIKSGTFCGFHFKKQDDGTWACLDDRKK